MKKTIVILLTILMLFSLFQRASSRNVVKADETYQWIPVNNGLYGGGEVPSLAIDPTNTSTIYAGTWGIYKSTNGGASWSAAGLTGVYVLSLAIDPTNTQVIYAGTFDGVFKSTDGGAHWAQINNGLTETSVYSLAIDPKHTQIIYVGTWDGVFKSINDGDSWNAIGNWLTTYKGTSSLAIDPANTQIIYAGTDDGCVFKSTDGGSSWSKSKLTNMFIDSLAIDPANTQVIYAGTGGCVFKSTDGGLNWTQSRLADGYVYSLAIDPQNTQIIYAGVWDNGAIWDNDIFDGVFKSTDGGTNWTQTGLKDKAIRSLVIDPKNTQIVYAGTDDDGVFKSTDGGGSWASVNKGLGKEVLSFAIDPENTQIVYAGTREGAFKSTNGGANWSQINTGLTNTDVVSLAIDPINTQVIYAGTGDGVFKSTDGGGSWAQTNKGLTDLWINSLVIDPKNTNIVYGIGVYLRTQLDLFCPRVFKSTDGGESWADEGLNGEALSLAIDPINTNTIYAGTIAQGAFKSTDGGESWASVNKGLWCISSLAIDSINTQIIYAVTLDGVFKSTDGGENWSQTGLANRNVESLAIDPKNTQVIYAGTFSGGVFKSIDEGASWTQINSGLTETRVKTLTIDPKNTQVIYAVTYYSGVFKYISSTYTIIASASSGGTINPTGAVVVNYGSNKSFIIKANPGFMIFRILVDGSQITISNPFTITYTFSNVTADHTISAEFMKILDTTPPTLTLPAISGIDLNLPNTEIKTNSGILSFVVQATDESGIGRMVVKINGVVQIDKNNLDPTIYLSEGVNTVEVTVYDSAGNYTTKFFKVISDTKPPVIDVTLPETVSSQELTVKGTVVDTVTGVQSVTVNGNPLVPTLEGNFETKLTLSTGANTITIEAVDKVGNKSTKSFTVSYIQPQAKQSYMIVLKVGSPTITVNGTSEKIDAQGSKPIIKDGRTLLPIRTLIESLGGTVEWDAKEQKVTITLNGHSMVLWIGKTTALVDGNKVSLDVAPTIINGRTYLPLRFISENLGASVNWDSTTQTVTIYYWP